MVILYIRSIKPLFDNCKLIQWYIEIQYTYLAHIKTVKGLICFRIPLINSHILAVRKCACYLIVIQSVNALFCKYYSTNQFIIYSTQANKVRNQILEILRSFENRSIICDNRHFRLCSLANSDNERPSLRRSIFFQKIHWLENLDFMYVILC